MHSADSQNDLPTIAFRVQRPRYGFSVHSKSDGLLGLGPAALGLDTMPIAAEVSARRLNRFRCRYEQAAVIAAHHLLCAAVARRLRENWSPRQISMWLKGKFPDDPSMQISHESLYRSLFIQARGALKKELVGHLRRAGLIRRAKTLAGDGNKQGQIIDAISIRERPAEAEDRAVPGHWEGDLLMEEGALRSPLWWSALHAS